MEKNTIGKIQIIIGFILIISTISCLLLFRSDHLNTFTNTVIDVTGTWGEVANLSTEIELANNLAPGQLKSNLLGFVVTDLVIISYQARTILYIMYIWATILSMLSAMFVLQGLSNITKE